MASKQVIVERSEDFFRVCNDRNTKNPYLRKKARILEALGVLGVSAVKGEEIMDWVVTVWKREPRVSLQFRAGKEYRRTLTTPVCNQFPEVFNMPCNGTEESKFVKEGGIHAMIWYATEQARNRRSKASRAAASIN